MLGHSFPTRRSSDLDRQVLAIEWSNAVFEALNWSVTLDERLRHDSEGEDWTVEIEGGSVIRALRYARNAVHHDWSAALDIGLPADEFLAPHSTVFGITWVDELTAERPDQRGAAAYAEAPAGRNLGETLLAAGKICEESTKTWWTGEERCASEVADCHGCRSDPGFVRSAPSMRGRSGRHGTGFQQRGRMARSEAHAFVTSPAFRHSLRAFRDSLGALSESPGAPTGFLGALLGLFLAL